MTLLAALVVQEAAPETIAQTFGVNWPQLTAQILSFSAVCVLLYLFAYKPVLRMLDARREQIAQGLANTEKINAALARIDADRERLMAEAHQQGVQLVAEARVAAARLQQVESERALANAERVVRQAKESAAQEYERMLAELKHEVGQLVARTTGAVLGRVLTAEDERRLADETAQQVN